MDALRVAIVVAGAAALAWMLTDDDGAGESANSPDIEDYGNQAISVFDYTDSEMKTQNERAFLAGIRVGEGTAAQNGYAVKFGGSTFSDFSDHPALLGWGGGKLSPQMCANAGFGPGCVSTAAGAYQINKPTWLRVSARLGLTDFSPASQDAAAMFLIDEKGALGDVQAGRTAAAVKKVRKVWASLPGAGYGQNEVSMANFNNSYTNAGGVLA